MVERTIKGWVKTYNSEVIDTLNAFRTQLTSVTSKSTKEITALKRLVEYFKTNKTQGTKNEFVNYVRNSANQVILGNYKESLLKNGGLATEIVKGYAIQRAKRLLIPQIVKHLKHL